MIECGLKLCNLHPSNKIIHPSIIHLSIYPSIHLAICCQIHMTYIPFSCQREMPCGLNLSRSRSPTMVSGTAAFLGSFTSYSMMWPLMSFQGETVTSFSNRRPWERKTRSIRKKNRFLQTRYNVNDFITINLHCNLNSAMFRNLVELYIILYYCKCLLTEDMKTRPFGRACISSEPCSEINKIVRHNIAF